MDDLGWSPEPSAVALEKPDYLPFSPAACQGRIIIVVVVVLRPSGAYPLHSSQSILADSIVASLRQLVAVSIYLQARCWCCPVG
jgi:hypothetical protein